MAEQTRTEVTPSHSPWIERVRQADAQAEDAFHLMMESNPDEPDSVSLALSAIAAELRAQRIARRPGTGR